ncbi:MAG TPA: heavy metal translocating P-type ATPase metal-binding domain-containing protein [Polyangiales bacterium]|nr:heavy metal translocating P-type ATPase metal-binding domain-containing protein [Polyangiales bacterium]
MFGSLPAAQLAHCSHCGNVLPSAARTTFCCSGCQSVHDAITHAGLDRYYGIKDRVIVPPSTLGATARCDKNWLAPLLERLRQADSAIELPVKLQGLRCVACVWLIQQLFERQPGAQQISINSARASARLCVDKRFPLANFAEELARFGYVLGDIGQSDSGEDGLLLRTGVCAALSMNAMFFSFAIYLGLHEGPLYKLLHALNFACASLAVLVGAPVFMTSAWAALRRRILHLDLPIAAGIALSYTAAVWSFVSGHAAAAYYDSLATFIALMLLGRWLKERVVLSNRRELLTNSGLEALLVRRVRSGEVSMLQATLIKREDELLIPPGDLVPVAGLLLDESARCSLDWINGESEPSEYTRGQLVPAGAFNASQRALRVRAQADFASSALVALLGQREQEPETADLTHTFSGWYVSAVLFTGVAAFAYWVFTSGDVTRGLEVMTAIYVVTCPCAIGIAVPLAEELTLSGLRQHGLFVRNASFLARARQVKRLVFDKTGTLTTGRLEVADLQPLAALEPRFREVLYALALASGHPKSAAIAAALRAQDTRWLGEVNVVETPGLGLEAELGAHVYRLGQGAWAGGGDGELCFSRDGVVLCSLTTQENLRDDARSELERLAGAGYETFILSGDKAERVQRLAAELGVPQERALGQQTPEDKAQFIARNDRGDMLMIGDGVNDSLAVAQAFTSGTPSIDRAVMPSRTDFYFVTAGLGPIRLALRAAHALARVTRRNQWFAVAYNVCVVAVALCGWMKPWLAAVLMPLSSLIVLAMTSLSLSRRSSLWKF